MTEPSQTLGFKTLPGLARAFRRWAGESTVRRPPEVTGATPDERHVLGALGGVAAAVAGDHVDGWPEMIQLWAKQAPKPPPAIVEAVCEGLGTRTDPLAALYDVSISPAHRRRLGTVFTPAPVVDHMLGLAAQAMAAAPACVIDPGAGVGAFTVAAAKRWPTARVLAIDVNVVTLGLLAARIAFELDAEPEEAVALGRIELVLGDYLDQLGQLKGTRGCVLTLGNPPYTRIQELPFEYRARALELCGGIIDSGHANLAVLFQAATLGHMRDRDASCMVLPGSVGYTRASRGLREALWCSRRPVRMQRTPATTRPFTGRSVQAAIVVIGSVETKRTPVQLARVQFDGDSAVLLEQWERDRGDGEPANWFWTDDDTDVIEDAVPLSEVAAVRRGIATGANAMFFLTDAEAASLPDGVITPAVPTLRSFTRRKMDKAAHASWGDEHTKRWLLVIPKDLPIQGQLRAYVEQFEGEVSRRFLPSQRKPWYSITDLMRPDLVIAPLAKTGFKVVANAVRAVPSNSLFGITMRNGTDPQALAAWLRSDAGQRELLRASRRYHGGSHKIEPGDLKRVRIPAELAVSRS
jgi:adenine-specific DNA-methyltransferase